jgi:hypothetical protein
MGKLQRPMTPNTQIRSGSWGKSGLMTPIRTFLLTMACTVTVNSVAREVIVSKVHDTIAQCAQISISAASAFVIENMAMIPHTCFCNV